MPVANPNFFTGNPLERLSEKRGDKDWLKAQFDHPEGVMVPFWRGMPLLGEKQAGDDFAKPVWLAPQAQSEFPRDADFLFLGLKGDRPYFAIDGSAAGASPEEAPFADMGAYTNLREAAGLLSREHLAIMGQATWLFDWHRRHSFCANCGNPSEFTDAGTKRICHHCETEHFPRTDPVAIVLVIHEDHCFLGRGPHFPPGFYSALAGFLEPGETLEECAAREIMEEAGIVLTNVRYIFSQPWPFPSSLMVGFIAETQSRDYTLDPAEIVDAAWISKDDIRKLLNGERIEGVNIPPAFAIAHQLLRVWAEE